MIIKFVLLSAIVLVNFVYSNAFAFGRECGENEKFASCGSPSPKTCDNYQEKQVRPMMCMPVCECIDDMVRNKLGQCVATAECDKENREKREMPDWVPKSEKDLWGKRNRRDVPNCVPKSDKDVRGKRYEQTRPRISSAALASLAGK